MCGIVGYVGSENPKGILLDGLKRLEYRGYDSAGIAILEKGVVEVFRCEGRLSNLEKRLTSEKFEGKIAIGHTRWATHGPPSEINAHPHQVGSVTLVHNGIIENFLELRDVMAEKGRKLSSDTDSEIIAHLIDIEIEQGKKLVQAVRDAIAQLKGSYALVILSDKDPDHLIGVRNGAPLLVGVGEKAHYLASDVQALLSQTKKVVYLKDGEMAICGSDSLTIEVNGAQVPFEVETVQWSPEQMDMGGYRHYMQKEIFEQPQALAHTIEGKIDHKKGVISLPGLALSSEMAKQIDKIVIVACGTARHAALVGKFYLERYTGKPVEVDFASEFRYREPIMTSNSLCISVSQSGETADTLAAVRSAKERNVNTLTICNVRGSTIARESDFVLFTNAGPEIGVASTKAFTTQLAVLYMLAAHIGRLVGNIDEQKAVQLAKDLMKLPALVDRTLLLEDKVKNLSEELESRGSYFYMGRGINYPIALEGALKLKEISYLHAEGYPGGELKHGPIALIDKEIVTVALAPGRGDEDPFVSILYEKMLSNIHEIKARRGNVISIVTEGDTRLPKESWHCLEIPHTSWALYPILLAIPMQQLAYEIASRRGTDVDKPRNLAKSVTVE